jgi:senataxin
MVGDPKQLPATIFSDKAKRAGYDRSLFERLTQSGVPNILLDTQYRMNPVISGFASRMFYQNRLRDGRNVREKDFGPRFIGNHVTAALSTFNHENECGEKNWRENETEPSLPSKQEKGEGSSTRLGDRAYYFSRLVK